MSIKKNESDAKTPFQLALFFIQRNILKNVQFYFMAFLVLFFWQEINQSSQNSILEKMQKDNEKSYEKVIGLTTDGRVIGIEKTQIDAANLQMVIARAIRDNFIVGRRELTKNYSVAAFTGPEDILKNSQRLKGAFDNFIYLGNPATLSDSDKAFQQDAVKYFSSYLKYLLMEVNENNLPHFISVTKMDVMQFIPDKNKFSIRIQYPCQTESIGNDGKAISQFGTNEILAEGRFDVAKGTPDNPFGLKIILKEMKMVEITPKSSNAGYTVDQRK